MINKQAAAQGGTAFSIGSRLLRGQVVKVLHADSKENSSNSFVQYEIALENGSGGVSTVIARKASTIFGANDFDEEILEPCEHAYTGTNDKTNTFKNRNGTIVIVGFLNGNINDPIILGALTHPKQTGAIEKDGIRYLKIFRGVKTEINKDGEWSVTYQSPFSPDGELVAPDTGPTMLKLDKNGHFSIVLSKDAESIVDTQFSREEKVTMTFKSGLVVTIDGANDVVKIDTKGGTSAHIDGSSGTIELKDNGTGKLKITGDKVAIGASSAELLQQISDSLQKIITWTNSVGSVHDHIGNLGYPTAPPTQASGYTSLGSDLSTIKGLVDGIKGTL
jgi:hypothetical protein